MIQNIIDLFRKKKPPVVPVTSSTGVKMVIVDHHGVKDDLAAIAAACTKQVQLHFGLPAPLGYNTSATVRVGANTGDIQADEWVIGLFTTPDQPGALGYHDKTPAGLPIIKVFPVLVEQDGESLSVTISHEILESLADPEGNIAVQAPDGKFWAYEVCDGVENDQYTIDGIWVSNFATPAYWGAATGKPYDHMGLCVKPLETRPGGYNQYFSPTKGWTQVLHKQAPSNYRKVVKGRAWRRRVRFTA